jgi:radical SAM protein with 4Fe4S-binding SPASM domain
MIELTYACNFDCVHCYVVQPSARGELDTSDVLRVLDELKAAGTLFLTFTGGEALRRPDFEEIWIRAKTLGFITNLFTNAALVKDKTLRLFERYPPNKVEVTLYGANEATYQAVTQRKNMHALVLANVDALLALGISVHLKAVGLAENGDDLEAILQEVRARGLEGFFKFDNQITARTDCTRGPTEHRLRVDAIVEQDRLHPKRIAGFRRLYLLNRGRRVLSPRLFRCGAGKNQLVIDPFGRMQTCALYRDEFFDLKSGSVADGWDFLQRVVGRRVTRPSRCRSCDKISLCGSCPGNNSLESRGDPEAPPDFLCEITYARIAAFCSDLRPALPEPTGRWLPLHRAKTCERPWLTPEPIGELVRPKPERKLPVVG